MKNNIRLLNDIQLYLDIDLFHNIDINNKRILLLGSRTEDVLNHIRASSLNFKQNYIHSNFNFECMLDNKIIRIILK